MFLCPLSNQNFATFLESASESLTTPEQEHKRYYVRMSQTDLFPQSSATILMKET